jgi:hypothetical protein
MAQFLDAQPSSSLLVYFSGVLGFSSDAQDFLPAKKYTPCLSGLIYIQRLLFLEYALPLRAYPHLRIPRRSRLQQYERFDGVRLRYMVTGSQSPLEEFQSLRDFGRVIARTDAPAFLLRWSDDGETVSYGDKFHLTMQDFCGLAEYFTVQAEELCEELMYDLDPVVDLASVKDDLTNTRSGFSFVKHPDNGLVDAYLDLSVKACTTRRKRLSREGRWDWEAIFSYRAKAEGLDEMLLGGLHTAGGQVPRAPELLGLEIQNGPSTERGIYVWNGFMVYLTRHHKAKRSNNREFYVVRFLPARLSRVMYKYLVYIRPFLDMLQRERDSYYKEVVPTRLLFRSGRDLDRPWDAARLTAILRKATAEVWGRPVNSQLYRQLTIGITEKHVQEVHKPFNRFDDVGARANRNVAFAWQSGHRPLQRATTYGLDGAFPARLQPALLRLYEWASTRWHEFLHQPSKTMAARTVARQALHARDRLSRKQPRGDLQDSGTAAPLDSSDDDYHGLGKRNHTSESREKSPDKEARLVKRRTLLWGSTQSAQEAPSSEGESRFEDFKRQYEEQIAIIRQKEAARPPTAQERADVAFVDRVMEEACKHRTPADVKLDEVFEFLDKWLVQCPLCHLRKEGRRQHTLQNCSHDRAIAARQRCELFQASVKYQSVPCCVHSGWDFATCRSIYHHTRVGSDFECQYKGVAITVIATVMQEAGSVRDQLCSLMRREGIDIRAEQSICVWLGRQTSWEGMCVPMAVKVFHYLGELLNNI